MVSLVLGQLRERGGSRVSTGRGRRAFWAVGTARQRQCLGDGRTMSGGEARGCPGATGLLLRRHSGKSRREPSLSRRGKPGFFHAVPSSSRIQLACPLLSQPRRPLRVEVSPDWAGACPGSACRTQPPGRCPIPAERGVSCLPVRIWEGTPRARGGSGAGRFTRSDVLRTFDRLKNKYGPTNCRFYGYLQPRHFVNLRTNISQRKSGSQFLINYWKFKQAPAQGFLSLFFFFWLQR